ncbi:PDGLE domain-containing protein [Actinomadura sp. KC216]|uniref:PDGLE domain-containing protein n=1 Tax=Actinomadura sp. KC216 TaxID=2530370 RepID=UPI001A9EA3D6|nr:PDGLE domain-containing protein [Actinomadura sp. KC216]
MTTKRFFIGFLAVSLVLAGIVSFYASAHPDGLEKVAEDKGISAKEEDHALKDSPLGDYGVKGIDNARLSGGLSGVIGVGAVLLVGGGLFWGVRRRGSSGGASGRGAEREEGAASGASANG